MHQPIQIGNDCLRGDGSALGMAGKFSNGHHSSAGRCAPTVRANDGDLSALCSGRQGIEVVKRKTRLLEAAAAHRDTT